MPLTLLSYSSIDSWLLTWPRQTSKCDLWSKGTETVKAFTLPYINDIQHVWKCDDCFMHVTISCFREDHQRPWEKSSFFLKAFLTWSITHTMGSSDMWATVLLPLITTVVILSKYELTLKLYCVLGKLLFTSGGRAFCRGDVRHSPPNSVQTKWKGHHQRLTHWPLPGQRDLLLGGGSVEHKASLPAGCSSDNEAGKCYTGKKYIFWTIIFHEIYNFPLLIFHVNIHCLLLWNKFLKK